ncbi:MAG TPA: hypothetical protein VFH37_03030 [Candidatus Saccharimonadales bacterium]|nr:hypothetical protein [Candidatus Saccharimonadales bacterium]
MNVLRRLCLALVSSLFVFLLFATAFDVGFVRTATNPATVKKIAADSGVYNTVVTNALGQLKTINTSVGTIDANNPLVQQAANQAITPQYVQQQGNAAIENIYQWLNGQIARPDFNIDLSAQNDQFAKNAANSLQQQLAGLPACRSLAQIQSFTVLNAVCLPLGVSAQAVASQVQRDLSNSNFLRGANISAANLKGQNGQSVFNNPSVQKLPGKYQLAKKTPWIFAVLTILCGLGVVFLSRTWQAGLRHIGINLVVIGVLMLALSFFLPRVISRDVATKLNVTGSGVSVDLSKVVNDVTRQIDKNYWFFGGLYMVAGAGAIMAAEVSRRRTQPAPAATSAHHPDNTVLK